MSAAVKDYLDTLEAIGLLATFSAIHNRLHKIRVHTEDMKLADLLGASTSLLSASSIRIKTNINLNKPEHQKLHRYCTSMIAKNKPQWQILAERNGWAPLE